MENSSNRDILNAVMGMLRNAVLSQKRNSTTWAYTESAKAFIVHLCSSGEKKKVFKLTQTYWRLLDSQSRKNHSFVFHVFHRRNWLCKNPGK